MFQKKGKWEINSAKQIRKALPCTKRDPSV